ncbi:hypothetical protein [Sphingosinicella sp. LY1275]|uniref:hypothetical protein n=1 Tax=Sphingosinicella sp. LY1275 TaxID=3095379 RepID=UPI002ADEB2D2|nr:hypothetical protein [Sphingosinicella sp. LY1275]MEA1013286.1 hypothetical protein [Sphingosinicella sp. LY1275]
MSATALHGIPLLVAGLLVAGCPSTGTTQNEGSATKAEVPAAPSAIPDPAVRGQVNCRTATQPAQRRACGTTEIPFEYPLEIGISRLTYISLGERGAEISRHIDAANRHLANARWAKPELAAAVLQAGAAEMRASALRVCRLEGKPPAAGDSIRSEFLKAYVWLEYRISLIEGDSTRSAERVDALLDDPCFGQEQELYFRTSPAALSSSGKFFYALPSYFARALSYYHARRGAPLTSDAYQFRADLAGAGNGQLSCFQKAFDPESAGQPPSARKLSESCLRLISRGQSCLRHARRCTEAAPSSTANKPTAATQW